MHTLFHIYGPFAIHSYGLAIAIGVLLVTYLMRQDPRFTSLKLESHFATIVAVGAAAGVLGGKLFFVLSEPNSPLTMLDVVAFWNPGFSLLGGILGIVTILPFYLYSIQIPVLPTFDFMAVYAPLLQSVSRLGCFLLDAVLEFPPAGHGALYTPKQDRPLRCIPAFIQRNYIALQHYFYYSSLYIMAFNVYLQNQASLRFCI